VAVEGARAAEEAAGDFDVESAEFRPDVPLLNSVVLTGRLGRDPTLRHVGADDQRKVALLTFSLAVTDEVPEGEWEEGAERGTSWFSCEMWGQRAEAASRFLRKGLRVGVDGQLGFSFYKDRGGAEVEAPVLIVRSFEVLQSRSESDGAWSDAASRPAKGYDAVPSRRPAAPPAPAARAAGGGEVEDDGLPF
jgi:single-strand DNA-binding protein